MAVEEIFRKLERQTERELMQHATRMGYQAQIRMNQKIQNPTVSLNNKKIAREVIWFFAAVAIGFIMGYLFYEVFTTWLPDVKKDLIVLLLQSEANFIYFLSALCFVGVYVCRATMWALSLL